MGGEGDFGRASVLRQNVNRSRLLEVVRAPDILVEVVADRGGFLDVRTVTWEDYWHPHISGLSEDGRQQLAALQAARGAYIASGVDLATAGRYCYCYFSLLQSTLRGTSGEPLPSFLQALAGLEAFGVRRFWDSGPQAAAIINLRHPACLLSRLRWPKAMVDPKFLPLTCLPPAIAGHQETSGLFYHYRQISLDANCGLALFAYPAVHAVSRVASFEPIEWLTAALRCKPDPWSGKRAKHIAGRAIAPFLEVRQKLPAWQEEVELALADVGGGSGILVSQICRELLEFRPSVVNGRRFAWTFVDLGVRNPARHTGNRQLRNAMSMAEYVQADYRCWVAQESSGSASPRWHVALLCRLLNNLSLFTVERTTDPREVRALAGGRIGRGLLDGAPWQPTTCLALGAEDSASLLVSNGYVEMRGGRSLRQLPLTDYFEALFRLTEGASPSLTSDGAVYFPVRRFNPEALTLDGSANLLERLCGIAELVVIEDVDLTPDGLASHLKICGLDGVAASDATGTGVSHSANLLCAVRRDMAACLPGRRLW